MGNTCQTTPEIIVSQMHGNDYFSQEIEKIICELRNIYIDDPKKIKSHKIGKNLIFRGEYANKVVDGYGQYINGNKYYYGQFQNGLPHGEGILISQKNCYLKGTFDNGKPHGIIQQKSQNFYFYGEFQYGERIKGMIETKNYKYDGQLSQNKFEGLGKLRLPTGQLYEGEFKQGKFNGMGKFKTKTGTYNGSFQQNRFQGHGIYRWNDGSFYDGQYKDGQKSGFGRYVKGQICFNGQWERGKPVLPLQQKKLNLLQYNSTEQS